MQVCEKKYFPKFLSNLSRAIALVFNIYSDAGFKKKCLDVPINVYVIKISTIKLFMMTLLCILSTDKFLNMIQI